MPNPAAGVITHPSPMNKKALLPLSLIVVAAGLSGCAHQTSGRFSHSSYLFGLVEVTRGAYQPASSTSIDGNSNELIGNSGDVSGTQVKLAWGALSTNDY